MKTYRTLRAASALLLLVGLSLHGGCAGSTPEPPDDAKAPEIPPQSTLVIDFNEFANDADPSAKVTQAIPGSTFLFAGGNLFVWNAAITVTLAVPVAAFLESFNHEAVVLDDGTWEWAYSFTVNAAQHSAALQADVKPSGVDWNMLISKDGDYTDFSWFTGHSNLARTEGTWTLNYPPNFDSNGPVPFIDIAWNRDPSAGTADIRYTNVTPDGPENGGYIFYGITGEDPYDAFFTIASAGDDHTVEIEFNTDSVVGRVRDEIHFNDPDWHCWDGAFQNADCPE